MIFVSATALNGDYTDDVTLTGSGSCTNTFSVVYGNPGGGIFYRNLDFYTNGNTVTAAASGKGGTFGGQILGNGTIRTQSYNAAPRYMTFNSTADLSNFSGSIIMIANSTVGNNNGAIINYYSATSPGVTKGTLVLGSDSSRGSGYFNWEPSTYQPFEIQNFTFGGSCAFSTNQVAFNVRCATFAIANNSTVTHGTENAIFRIDTAISNPGGYAISKSGTGTWTFTGPGGNTGLSGYSLTISGGLVQINGTDKLGPAAGFVIGAGSALELVTDAWGSGRLSAGNTQVRLNGNGPDSLGCLVGKTDTWVRRSILVQSSSKIRAKSAGNFANYFRIGDGANIAASPIGLAATLDLTADADSGLVVEGRIAGTALSVAASTNGAAPTGKIIFVQSGTGGSTYGGGTDVGQCELRIRTTNGAAQLGTGLVTVGPTGTLMIEKSATYTAKHAYAGGLSLISGAKMTIGASTAY